MTPSRRNALILAAVGIAAAGSGLMAGAFLLQSGSGASALLSATYPDLAGRPVRLFDLKGKILVCNFWATWCAPCREEMPMLSQLQDRYSQKGVEFVGIGIDSGAKIAEFAKNHPVSYPLLVAGPEAIELMRSLGNRGGALPFTVMLDRSGAVAFTRLGALTREEAERALVGFLR